MHLRNNLRPPPALLYASASLPAPLFFRTNLATHPHTFPAHRLIQAPPPHPTPPSPQYERILGKAALGRGPAEHWAHADYGWLLYQEGDVQVGASWVGVA